MNSIAVTPVPSRTNDLPLLSPGVLLLVIRLTDVLVIAGGGMLSYWLRHGFEPLPDIYLLTLCLAAMVGAYVFHFAGIYAFPRIDRIANQLARLTTWWVVTALILLGIAFFTGTSYLFSRVWLAFWMPTTILLFAGSRVAVRIYIQHWRKSRLFVRYVAIVGAGDIGAWLVKQLQVDSVEPLQVVGIFDDRMARFTETHPLHIDGTVDDLMKFVRQHRVDMVVVALPSQAEGRLDYLIEKLRMLPVEVHLCPGRIGYNLERSKVVSIGGVPLLRVVQRPLDEWGWLVKTVVDFCLAFFALVVLAIPLLLIALAIKLDSPGPICFRQERTGFNGRIFRIFKFRSMTLQASAASEVQQATRGDTRVTRLGRFLRHSSIDELPQLLNVLRGEMSLVGPRPHAVQHDDKFARIIGDYPARMKVKPGITGWAQINGLRGEVSTPEDIAERVRYDLHYVDNWSVAFDFKIMLLTVVRGFFSRKAY